MSDTNPLDTTAGMGAETKSVTGSKGCCLHGAGPLLRAVIYTPMLLAAGALSVAAVFPELAEYASPLLDLPKSVCPFSGACSSGQAESACCAHSQACLSSSGAETSTTDASVDLVSTGDDEAPADALAALDAAESEATSN